MLFGICVKIYSYNVVYPVEKPHNPMVNAGAIIVCSLLKTMVRPELTLAEKFDYTLQYFKVRLDE
jgi:glutaminase